MKNRTSKILLLLLHHFSRVWLCVTPQTAAHQAPLSPGFSRQDSSVENCLGEESLSICNSSLPMPLPAWDQQMKGTFIGKNKKIWLQVESVSSTFCCFPKLKGYCLYIMPYLGEPGPSAWMWNQSAVVQRDILINTAPPEADHSRGYLQD